MGRFCDLPKDVVWLILRQTFLHRRNDLRRNWTLSFLSLKELEQTTFMFGNVLPYIEWLCDLALINKHCFKMMRAKTWKISNEPGFWGFKRGALNVVDTGNGR
jgi:hypothetical protein